MKEELSPYRAIFAHLEYDPWEGNGFVIQGGWSENIEFTHLANGGGYSLWFQRFGLGCIYNNKIDDTNSLEVEVQLLKESDNSPGREDEHWEEYMAVSWSRSPNLIVTGVLERTEDVNEVGAKEWKGGTLGGEGKYWPSLEVAVDFFERHQNESFLRIRTWWTEMHWWSLSTSQPIQGCQGYIHQ